MLRMQFGCEDQQRTTSHQRRLLSKRMHIKPLLYKVLIRTLFLKDRSALCGPVGSGEVERDGGGVPFLLTKQKNVLEHF